MNNIEKQFVEFVKQHERVIYKVCSFYRVEGVPIEDLYQEVVCNLWNGFSKFRNESTASTWIYRIAINTCISDMRKEKHRPKGDIPVSSLGERIAEPESMTENIREMYRIIYDLRTIEKTVILLWLEEKTYQEIADITGLSLSNVATKLKRTKEKIKQMLNR